MGKMIRTYIADSSMLIIEGLKKVLDECSDIEVVGDALNQAQMESGLIEACPDVLLIDYTSGDFKASDVESILTSNSETAIVGICNVCEVSDVKRLLSRGLDGHLMNDCDRDEIVDSIRAAAKGEKFFCGQVLNAINESEGLEAELNCEPIVISGREVEILQLIAGGMTTKQIGVHLHISFHTVMTHRKNMMAKLGIKNTAGLIIYAVKENLVSPNKYLFSTS